MKNKLLNKYVVICLLLIVALGAVVLSSSQATDLSSATLNAAVGKGGEGGNNNVRKANSSINLAATTPCGGFENGACTGTFCAAKDEVCSPDCKCTKRVCQLDEQCSVGLKNQICSGGLCADCRIDSDCIQNNTTCVTGKCLTKCTKAVQCSYGQVCANGACMQCGSSKDCKGKTPACVGGTCVQCDETHACPKKQVCDLTKNICNPA